MLENDKDPGLVDLASSNYDLKLKITDIIENIEDIDSIELEAQVVEMLKNMMNFFARYVEEIPNFDSLTLEQQQALLKKFKAVSKNLIKRKIKSIDEMTQVFVFTVLNGLGETLEDAKSLTAEEILHKKHKESFRKFLRKAADFEVSQIIDDRSGESHGRNFISDSIKLGVREALKNANLDLKIEQVDQSALKILEAAHKTFKKSKELVIY